MLYNEHIGFIVAWVMRMVTEKEMKAMSNALACKLNITFTLEETEEQI
jgi:hypothetical protein